jgi:hypothetical protein
MKPERTVQPRQRGLLIVNADDWGRDPYTTDQINRCVERGAVSSVSAMVFMEDSERAAAIAREKQIDAGLHLNLTTGFSDQLVAGRLAERQAEIARYLRSHRLARVMFNPALSRDFEYVVSAQLDEFRRLYGRTPDRIDGHHHMHLCANVMFGGLLPPGTLVRRNFSFEAGEKSACNRMYRGFIDGLLDRRHRLVDYLFSLQPLEPASRLERIFALARRFVVELETHPVEPGEYRFLHDGEFSREAGSVRVAPACAIPALP